MKNKIYLALAVFWGSNVKKCTKGEMGQSLYRILKHPESRDKLHCHTKLASMTHEVCFEDP